MGITVTDYGADRMVEALGVRPMSVKVGVIGAKAAEPKAGGELGGITGNTVVEIATIHEFGLGDNPRRSFIASYVDEDEANIRERLHRAGLLVIKDKITLHHALDLMGLYIVGQMQERMADGIPPPLSKKYAARMNVGRKDTLIRTGQLRSSITHEVSDG